MKWKTKWSNKQNDGEKQRNQNWFFEKIFKTDKQPSQEKRGHKHQKWYTFYTIIMYLICKCRPINLTTVPCSTVFCPFLSFVSSFILKSIFFWYDYGYIFYVAICLGYPTLSLNFKSISRHEESLGFSMYVGLVF